MTAADPADLEPETKRQSHPYLRPRDSATLILLDRSGGAPRVLMGRRHTRHVFMPGRFVFPGGRTETHDNAVKVAGELHPIDLSRLTARCRISSARAKAIALSAVRETYEETGLLIGRPGAYSSTLPGWQPFAEHGVQPSLDAIRFVARAITPPGRIRRFDSRFFAAWNSEIGVALPEGPSGELEALAWLTLDEARAIELPYITKIVLDDLENRLREDPELQPGPPVPFYRMQNRKWDRELI